MNKLFLGIAIFALICFSAFSQASDNQAIESLIVEATKLHQDAIAIEGGWTDTEKLINKAKTLLDKNDLIGAKQAAQKAKMIAQLSVNLAKDQRVQWSEPPYIKEE